MKWLKLFSVLAILILELNVNNAYAKNPKISKNKVEYISSKDLTCNFKKQSSLILDLENKYQNRNIYIIHWKNPSHRMSLEYNAKNNKLTLKMETESGKLAQQEIYLGKIKNRLEDVANSKMKTFDYHEDFFMQQGNTAYLRHPSYKK